MQGNLKNGRTNLPKSNAKWDAVEGSEERDQSIPIKGMENLPQREDGMWVKVCV